MCPCSPWPGDGWAPCPVLLRNPCIRSPALGTSCKLGGKFSSPTCPQIEARYKLQLNIRRWYNLTRSLYVCPVEGLRDAPDTGAAWGVIKAVLRLGTENVRDWWLVHSVSWAARRVPSVMGGHCLVLPRTLATPVTNQRPGNPGTDQSEARHQWGGAPLDWSGPGRLHWPDSGAGAEISKWREPGLATLAQQSDTEQIATDKTATRLQNIAACLDQSGQKKRH